jgi:hypothetical protein
MINRLVNVGLNVKAAYQNILRWISLRHNYLTTAYLTTDLLL